MGQYYRALVIDENNLPKKLHPGAFEEGVKLMEHAWIGNEFVDAVYTLIHNNPCQVAWIGDYSDEPYNRQVDAYAKAMPYIEFEVFYHYMFDDGATLTPDDFTGANWKRVGIDTKGMYLVNHDLKSYLDMAAYIQRSAVRSNGMRVWCANPLPLLTACGNGRGGGDFRGGQGYEDIGTWAFHRIEYTDKIPQGYCEKDYCFIEASA